MPIGLQLLGPAFTGLVTGGKVALPPADPPGQAEFYGYGFRHTVTDRRITFDVYAAALPSRVRDANDCSWIDPAESGRSASGTKPVGTALKLHAAAPTSA